MLVAVEVEVIYLSIHPGKPRLMVECLEKSGPGSLHTLQGLLDPEESPEVCARRLLDEVVGSHNVLHPPEFVQVQRYSDRQTDRPTLTLTYAVLGRPFRAVERFPESLDVDDQKRVLEDMVNHPGAVRAAREVVARLLETSPIALQLLVPQNAPFTLDQVWTVYRCVRGREKSNDRSNFRRKIEAAKNFVVEYRGPTPEHAARRRIGKPPRWYVAGTATTLDPPIRFER